MSDSWIVVIPEKPMYRPDEQQKQRLRAELQRLAPRAEEIAIEADGPQIRFFDCGENFESVRCPGCGEELDSEIWGSWMSADYGAGPGFSLARQELACCDTTSTLNELRYDMPQGFACFGVSARNCDRGHLTAAEQQALTMAIGAQVRVIYRYI